MALNPLAKALLQPDHNMSHHAICDGGDKATKTNPITSPTSQGQTVANLNPSEPSKVEENKSAEAALGQEVGFTVDAPALVVKQEEKEELREFKEEEPDVVVEGSQKSQMISPQSSGNESPARSIHQYAVPSKEQHRADDFEGFVETDAEVDFLTDEEYEILTVDYGILEMSEEEAEEEEVEVQAEPIELRKDEDVDELANELENKVNI
jgi:hypothetical protein